MWAGKVGFRHTNVCVERLFNNPRSRVYVAARGGDARWFGFDETTRATIGVYNLIASLLNGFGGKIDPWETPNSKKDDALFAPNIASFDPNAFLGVINGG